MSDYPGEIDSHREYINLPGRSYNPADTKNIYAEDLIGLWEAIIAIQTVLGINPQGDFVSVKARLDGSGPGDTDVLVTETGEHIVWAPGERIII